MKFYSSIIFTASIVLGTPAAAQTFNPHDVLQKIAVSPWKTAALKTSPALQTLLPDSWTFQTSGTTVARFYNTIHPGIMATLFTGSSATPDNFFNTWTQNQKIIPLPETWQTVPVPCNAQSMTVQARIAGSLHKFFIFAGATEQTSFVFIAQAPSHWFPPYLIVFSRMACAVSSPQYTHSQKEIQK